MSDSTTQQRQAAHDAKAQQHRAKVVRVTQMKQDGMSNVAIAEELEVSESTVRRLLQDTEEN